MAQSRLFKFASIINRVEGFLNSGAIKPEDKPIWFDVYKRFPPWIDPIYLQPLPQVKVRPIFYHEDRIRAEFYKVFGSPGVIEMQDPSKIPVSELFIERYLEIARSTDSNIDDVTLFNLAANKLREAGYRLRKYQGSDDINLPQIQSPVKAGNSQKQFKSSLNVTTLMNDE